MTRAISEDEFVTTTPDLLSNLDSESVVIQRDGTVIGALISAEEYELVRRARAARAIDALEQFGRHMQSVATPEELDELVRELDRKSP
jgi:hypothetical protein